MKLLAFDLEIAALNLDDSGDWKAHRPLGITCAALAWKTNDGTLIEDAWHGEDAHAHCTPRMSEDECINMVYALMAAVDSGFTLLTHNGVSFDLDVLAEESGMRSECVELAMNSVDTCLLMHCLRGFPVGLDAICQGFGIQGKLEGMDGAKAPAMWSEGKYDEVLAYVAQDARCTLEVALAIEKHRLIRWVSKSGNLRTQIVPSLMPVSEALALPAPDVSWMAVGAIPRSRFTEWMDKTPT